jgi:lipoprotein NlpI
MKILTMTLVLATGLSAQDVGGIYRSAVQRFMAGNFRESVAEFDRLVALEPERAPHLWERGIALYYAGRYADCASQFESHRTVNPGDVENSAWHYLCVAKLKGAAAARAGLLPVQPDARIPMMRVFALYKGEAQVSDVLAAARAGNPPEDALRGRMFFANLYIGLYYEAAGNGKLAREYIAKAAAMPGNHYMAEVARVHVK